MIRHFKRIDGKHIQTVSGQNRYAFNLSDTTDFLTLQKMAKQKELHGSTIRFFDFKSGNVYEPFVRKANVFYSEPTFLSEIFYFLQVDYNEQKVSLCRYTPGSFLEKETELCIGNINLSNLKIIGSSVNIVSQGKVFECFYPLRFSFPDDGLHHAILIDGGMVHFQDSIDDNSGGVLYRVVSKDFSGYTRSIEVGFLRQAADGTWWIV